MKRVINYRSHLLLVLAVAVVVTVRVEFAARGAESSVARTPAAGITNCLTLDEAIQMALQNNPALRAANGKVNAAEGRAGQAGLWTNPELELSAEDWPANDGRGFSDAKQLIGVAQTLPFPGKKALDRRIGRAGVAFSEAELILRRTELVRDVKAGFFRVLAAQQLAGAAQELAKVAEASSTTARKRAEAGATAYQEQLRAEIQLEQAKAENIRFQLELGTARQVLATLLGRADLNETPLSGALAESSVPALLDDKPPQGLALHPGMVAAQAGVDRARLEQRRTRREPYPDVKVSVAGGRIGETDESIIQVGFTLPLPVFDRSKGRQQEALANVAVAEAEMTVVEQQLQRDWANGARRYRAAVEQVAAYRDRILPKAGEALQLVQRGFEEGKFNFIDLLDTQRTTAEARLTYQQMLLEMNVAQAQLEALLHPHTTQSPSSQLKETP